MATTTRNSATRAREDEEPIQLQELKLRPPAPRPGLVERSRLIELLQESEAQILTITAPAGYGKTLLLSQWHEREPRPMAWLSLDRSDNDAATLLGEISAALGWAGLLGDDPPLPRFASGSAISHGVPRLAGALRDGPGSGILVLDNFDALRVRAAIDVAGALLHQLAGGIQVAVASRSEPRIAIGALRAQGALLELTAGDLAFDREDAARLLSITGVDSGYDLDMVMERTEGWPVGIYLTGLAMGSAGPAGRSMEVGGDDLYVADYLRSEILDHLSESQVTFLTRTSILDQMSGPLCDWVLEAAGSARTLEALERSNLLMVRLDRTGEWHRYHHMFQALLQSELALREPGMAPVLHARAAEWFESQDMPEIAISHAQAANDIARVARIVDRVGRIVFANGRSDTLFDWLEWLDKQGAIDEYPEATALGALASSVAGDPAGVERWSVAGAPEHPVARLARAVQTRSGVGAMVEDARRARADLPPGSGWLPGALLIEGLGRLWEGEATEADALLAEAISLAQPLMATATSTMALSARALVAARVGDWERAEDLTAASVRLTVDYGLEGYTTSALGLVMAGRLARRRNDIDKAHSFLARAATIRPLLNVAMPGVAVQAHIELARAYLELSDTAGAREVLRQAEDVLAQRPDLGVLPDELAQVKRGLSVAPGTVGPTTLTAAELRLLPMLATHLTFPEIGERLFVSRHTVKTQAMSIYRKLGASSRSEAVQMARVSGMLGA